MDLSLKKAVLFDLDGTLTDPGEGIVNSFLYALSACGIPILEERSLYREVVGPPLVDSFVKFAGFDREKARETVEIYREYFRDRGIFENVVYPGIPELLRKNREKGRRNLVATSKPEEFSRRILSHFALAPLIDGVAGATMDEKRTGKKDVIAHALRVFSLRPEEAVMVGDRKFDAEGAEACGVDFIGVTYGYGTREELTLAGAEELAESVGELMTLLQL